MPEKRSVQRSPIELAASYGIGDDLRPEKEAKINNVSAGGFCFVSAAQLNVGEEIQLAVDLDVFQEAVILVRVVWVEKMRQDGKYNVGVEITEKEGVDFERFIKFIGKK